MFHIEGRRWFQRTYGNTYHSVRIYQGTEQLICLPYQYGYGEQYIETALQWLESNGHIAKREQYSNGGKPSGTRHLRDIGASHSCIDVGRQKDL